LAILLAFGLIACRLAAVSDDATDQSFPSQYPIAVDIDKVGKYPVLVKSGGGYFYDEVLEYRVWVHPERGGEDLYDGNDYYLAFVTYEEALESSRATEGAELPLVLVLQREWIDEPEPGVYIAMDEERITEWQVQWLEGNKREADSIIEFIDGGTE